MTMKTVNLSLYLQKYIIKYLCEYIDDNNKIIDSDASSDYGDDELLIKKLMISLALVNRYWFTVLSENLKVCVDFNYGSQGKYTIIKKENIETIKLHYDNENGHESFYADSTYDFENQIDMEYIRQELSELSESNCKQLILRNVNRSYEPTNILVTNELDKIFLQFQNVHILQYEINEISNPNQLSIDQNLVNQVSSIKFNNFYNYLLVKQIFSCWSKSIKRLLFVSTDGYGPDFPIFKFLSGEIEFGYLSKSNDFQELKNSTMLYRKHKEGNQGANYLSTLEEIEIYEIPTEIEDICTIISNAVNLKHLAVDLCFNNLIFFLLTDQERSQGNIRRCDCDSIVQNDPDTFKNENDIATFRKHWTTLKSKIKSNNSTLAHLKINHSCSEHVEKFVLGTQDVPDSFIKEFSQFFYLFSSLETLSIRGINTPKFFEEILKYNNSITSFHIITYDDTVNDFEEYTESLNQLVENNPQIKEMVFIKNLISQDNHQQEHLLVYKK